MKIFRFVRPIQASIHTFYIKVLKRGNGEKESATEGHGQVHDLFVGEAGQTRDAVAEDGDFEEEDDHEGQTTQVWTNKNEGPTSNRKNLASRHSTGAVAYDNDQKLNIISEVKRPVTVAGDNEDEEVQEDEGQN